MANPNPAPTANVIYVFASEALTGQALTDYNTFKTAMETAGKTVIFEIGPPVAPHK